ncbi:Thioesterase/thiol ester dehydrase-isomerase [Ephemerocybe angulata]|uniref:Thioesterase/thiol ester dehydrase-isomerase n=1 Tax=Ephemerocybe angulata TaxID=980116 RepID=A0A8H6MB76_9AGAR|nr:Thioesterase/thiol ester dehydrase-isomerase [Tulosesus angulatus]
MPMRDNALWSESVLKLKEAATSTSAPTTSSDEEKVVPRRMHDSYAELVLPFASDVAVLEQYINATGGIRTGKIMENLDSLAGSIAYKHMLGPGVESLGPIETRGYYIVTASVDRLDMLSPLDPKRDLRLSGQVIYTGRSSMEVVLKMESIGSGKPDDTVMIGRFSMVCRNAVTHKSHKVNPLIISTPEERALYSLGEHMKGRRQLSAAQSLTQVPPTSDEAAQLHAFYLSHGRDTLPSALAKPTADANANVKFDTAPQKERVWMGDTVLAKTLLMFPQERNVHQKVFGGYLMRLAYELGFANASMFCRDSVRFLSLDGISFARPVPIGSILKLESMIMHTASNEEYPALVHVGVRANVVDVKTGTEKTTNDFRFTWCQDSPAQPSAPGRHVVPKTYAEAMLWLEGRRALELGSLIRGTQKEKEGEIAGVSGVGV